MKPSADLEKRAEAHADKVHGRVTGNYAEIEQAYIAGALSESEKSTVGTDLAFVGPTITRHGSDVTYGNGLTKREWFAAQAMNGLLTVATKTERGWGETVAEASVLIADKMIEELNK